MKIALAAGFVALSAGTVAAEPLRIVTLGTSLTQSGDWQAPLAERLAAATGCPIQVFEVARAGETSTWGIAQLSRVASLKPDAVIVEFAINDAHLRQGIGLDRSVDQMRIIVRRLKIATEGGPIVVALTNPVLGIGQFARRPRLDAYFRAHAALARAEGVLVVDTRPAWRAHIALVGGEALPDGLHPRERDAQAILPAALTPVLATSLAHCRPKGAHNGPALASAPPARGLP